MNDHVKHWARTLLVVVATVVCGCSGEPSAADAGSPRDGGSDAAPTADAGAAIAATAHPSCFDTAEQIQPTPDSETALRNAGLTRLLRVGLPGGGSVRFFAQDRVSDAQLLRAGRVFRFYLENVEGSAFGQDKASVVASLLENEATLVFFNTQADSERAIESLPLGRGVWQDLYATESPVEGSSAYLNNTTRDATFEELFHLLQGAGIQPALPSYQQQLEAATTTALANSVWTPPADTLAEWRAEGSESFEYIISVIDVFYGLWEHAPAPSFHGEYQVAARGELDARDPLGVAALRAFLPEFAGHWVELDPSFEGSFSMVFDAANAYTLKSQHLRDVSLSGDNDASIVGNGLDNTLRGNAGANVLDGAGGNDTVVYCRERSAYEVTTQGGATVVSGPDGRDELRNIEAVRFADESLTL